MGVLGIYRGDLPRLGADPVLAPVEDRQREEPSDGLPRAYGAQGVATDRGGKASPPPSYQSAIRALMNKKPKDDSSDADEDG